MRRSSTASAPRRDFRAWLNTLATQASKPGFESFGEPIAIDHDGSRESLARLFVLILMQAGNDRATSITLSIADRRATVSYTIDGRAYELIPPSHDVTLALIQELIGASDMSETDRTGSLPITLRNQKHTLTIERESPSPGAITITGL